MRVVWPADARDIFAARPFTVEVKCRGVNFRRERKLENTHKFRQRGDNIIFSHAIKYTLGGLNYLTSESCWEAAVVMSDVWVNRRTVSWPVVAL